MSIGSAALEVLTKLGWYMQRGDSPDRSPSTEYLAEPDNSGYAQRNLDTDVKGTYLFGGTETRRRQPRRERKHGIRPKRPSSHAHMRRDPTLDTASSASDTWNSITDERGGPEID